MEASAQLTTRTAIRQLIENVAVLVAVTAFCAVLLALFGYAAWQVATVVLPIVWKPLAMGAVILIVGAAITRSRR